MPMSPDEILSHQIAVKSPIVLEMMRDIDKRMVTEFDGHPFIYYPSDSSKVVERAVFFAYEEVGWNCKRIERDNQSDQRDSPHWEFSRNKPKSPTVPHLVVRPRTGH